jgi:phosphoheptose isomerase
MKTGVRELLDECLTRYSLLKPLKATFEKAFDAVVACYKKDGTVLVCGNGGSAADTEHIVGELMKKFKVKRPAGEAFASKMKTLGFDNGEYITAHLERPLRAISLISQVSLISAVINDIGGDMIFAQQVFGYGKKGDVLIGMSTSGNAVNVVNAIKVAKALDMVSIGFTAENGGTMKTLCDICFCVPATETFKAQELHLPIYHVLCAMVELEFFGS